MKSYASVDEYLENIEAPQSVEFERIRNIVKKLVPDAEETISYGMPTFKHNGKPVLYFGAFKDHMSVFPVAHLTEELKTKLPGYKFAKGTIQFTNKNPLPESIIKKMVQARLDDINAGKPSY